MAYPAGYSLVGLPGATVASTSAPSYGWFDAGAGGQYSILPAAAGVEAGHGYWSWSACPRVVTLAPGTTHGMSMALAAYHASLVGNPTAGPVKVSGYDYAARWDPKLHSGAGGYVLSRYRQPLTLGVGEGLWVFSYSDSTVTIAR